MLVWTELLCVVYLSCLGGLLEAFPEIPVKTGCNVSWWQQFSSEFDIVLGRQHYRQQLSNRMHEDM